jgi:hypothetical protein
MGPVVPLRHVIDGVMIDRSAEGMLSLFFYHPRC